MRHLAIRLAVVALFACGCVGGVQVRSGSDGIPHGGAIMAEVLTGAAQFGTEASYSRLDSANDGGHVDVFAEDFTARYGMITSILQERCKSNEFCETPRPHVEFGPAAAAGVALTGDFDLGAHASAGGFVDYRQRSAEDNGWLIRAQVQRDVYSGDVRSATQFSLTFGWISPNKSSKE